MAAACLEHRSSRQSIEAPPLNSQNKMCCQCSLRLPMLLAPLNVAGRLARRAELDTECWRSALGIDVGARVGGSGVVVWIVLCPRFKAMSRIEKRPARRHASMVKHRGQHRCLSCRPCRDLCVSSRAQCQWLLVLFLLRWCCDRWHASSRTFDI